MTTNKIYEPSDTLISIIRDNYNVLQSIGAFGINLGFGDKTVKEVCQEQGVDTYTFLAVINYSINGYRDYEDIDRMSVSTLLHYLKASHEYFIGFSMPFIRRELVEALDESDNLARLILKLYDEYVHSVTNHMQYEERNVFPYVEALMAVGTAQESTGKLKDDRYGIDTYSKHHNQVDQKLSELKNIIIKYLPSDGKRNNQLSHTLYDIHDCEIWLSNHAQVEDNIFIPVIRHMEKRLQQNDVTAKISNIISQGAECVEMLSSRERDVIVSVVQGMTNKQIADHLCISINTVITHRRNIARKLQIHSSAGLTIYAIVNNLVDISNVQL